MMDTNNGTAGQAMRVWNYETMFPADLEQALKELPVAWLPVSPLEWHGDAMAFGCDAAIGRSVCRAAWEILGGVMLPLLYLGTGTNYTRLEAGKGPVEYWELETITGERNPGSLFVQPATLGLVIHDYLHFLEREGFRLCVIVSGHGAIDHIKVIQGACAAFNHSPGKQPESLQALFFQGLSGSLPEELCFPGSGGHADFEEASLLGGIDPSMVDRGRFGVSARDRSIGVYRQNADKIDYDKGMRVIRAMASRLADEVIPYSAVWVCKRKPVV